MTLAGGSALSPMPGLDPARQARAQSYARSARLIYFLGVALGAVFFASLLLSGAARLLADLIDLPVPLSAVAFFCLVVALYAIVSSPLAYYHGFVMPHRYGLATRRSRSWLEERAKYLAVFLALGSVVVAFVYWTFAAFPGAWWLLSGLLVLSVTVVLNLVAPVAIMPLFCRCTPAREGEMTRRLMELARRAGTGILGVFTIDQSRRSVTANAMLIGLGRARRIVVSEGLAHAYSPDEVEAIMAHELGHHLHHDIPRLIVLQSALGLGGFILSYLVLNSSLALLGLRGVSDVAGLPLVMMTVGAFSVVSGPFVAAYVRRLEGIADRRALQLTGNADAFVSLMTKLANQNLTEADPGRWAKLLFYDHPTYRERVKLAWKYKEAAKGGAAC